MPEGAAPGTYRGTIQITPANAPPRQLRLELEVLPFALAEPDRHYSVAYAPLRSFAGVELPGDRLTYMRQDYEDMRAHGVTSAGCPIPLEVSRGADGSVEIDYSEFIAAMDLITELGFTGSVHWRGIYHLYRDLKRLGLSQVELEAAYIEAVATVVELREERDWPEIYFFPVDEPFGNPEKEAEFYYLAPLIKRVPGALVEVSLNGAEELPPEADPYVDLRSYSGWSVGICRGIPSLRSPLKLEFQAISLGSITTPGGSAAGRSSPARRLDSTSGTAPSRASASGPTTPSSATLMTIPTARGAISPTPIPTLKGIMPRRSPPCAGRATARGLMTCDTLLP